MLRICILHDIMEIPYGTRVYDASHVKFRLQLLIGLCLPNLMQIVVNSQELYNRFWYVILQLQSIATTTNKHAGEGRHAMNPVNIVMEPNSARMGRTNTGVVGAMTVSQTTMLVRRFYVI